MSTPETGRVQVIGIDLTDLDATGNSDPLGGVLIDLSCTAARLVQAPAEAASAVFVLGFLQGYYIELPEFATLLGHMRQLLEVAAVVVDEARSVPGD